MPEEKTASLAVFSWLKNCAVLPVDRNSFDF
jgi:hypothetical protein